MGTTEDAEETRVTADEVIDHLERIAEEIADNDAKASGVWVDIEHEPLREAMGDAAGAIKADLDNAAGNTDEAAQFAQLAEHYGHEPVPAAPKRHLYAAYTAAALVINADRILTGRTPPLTAGQRARGAEQYVQWWAFTLASHLANLPAAEAQLPLQRRQRRAVERRFMNCLATLPLSHPEQRNATIKTLMDHLRQLSTGEFTTADTEAEPRPAPSRSAIRRWWSSVKVLRTTTALLTAALLAASLSAVLLGDRDSVAEQTPMQSVGTPTPVPETFSAPVLQDASLQLFAYHENTPLDPTVQAVPNQPAQHSLTVDVAHTFIVEIHLTRRDNPAADPSEKFFLGFWASALLKPLPAQATTITPDGHEKNLETPLSSKADTAVTDLDSRTPTVYRIPIFAVPQMENPRAAEILNRPPTPSEEYNCGFNAGQVINVLFASSSHAMPIVTTLPISVRRTEGC